MTEPLCTKRILALDIGDQWTGVALSDVLKTLAKPLITVKTAELEQQLAKLFSEYVIKAVVVGNPITLKGTKSLQTEKVIAHKEQLAQRFPTVEWLLWDERLTSKQAAQFKRFGKKNKHQEHAFAAAIILQNYLDYLSYQQTSRAT